MREVAWAGVILVMIMLISFWAVFDLREFIATQIGVDYNATEDVNK